jgi:hypothetical protein
MDGQREVPAGVAKKGTFVASKRDATYEDGTICQVDDGREVAFSYWMRGLIVRGEPIRELDATSRWIYPKLPRSR